jgi:hypothetical protein
MVAAWLKIAILMMKAPQTSKKQWPNRQNVFSKHQNASTAAPPTGAEAFCKRLSIIKEN